MTKGTQTTLKAPQTSRTPAPKKGKSLKIFLGILGGCVVILIIVGIVGWILVKKAAKKAGEEFKKVSKELEQSFNELEKTNPSLNEQLKNLEDATPTPTEKEAEVAPGP